MLWNLYLDDINIVAKVNNNTQICDCEYKIFIKNFECSLRDVYLRYLCFIYDDVIFYLMIYYLYYLVEVMLGWNQMINFS